jgi:hypothetical protein
MVLVNLITRLRNMVEGDDSVGHRDAVRSQAIQHAHMARVEVQKSRAQRELEVMEEQYRRRQRALGRRG